MPNPDARFVVTANDLMAGDVVFLTAERCWTRDIHAAAVADADAAARLLADAEAQEARIVGPYLAEVVVDAAGRPRPTHFRERFRLLGPSNRPDLGRQAQASDGRA